MTGTAVRENKRVSSLDLYGMQAQLRGDQIDQRTDALAPAIGIVTALLLVIGVCCFGLGVYLLVNW